MKHNLKEMKVEFDDLILILCDYTSAINISKISVMHSRTKHISIKYHFLREKVANKEVKLEYVETKKQITNIFTKPLSKETFEYLWKKLGVVAPSS